MARLRLMAVQCFMTEDFVGNDELYIKVGGEKIWGPKSITEAQTKSLTSVKPIPFKNKIRIDLYDKDTGFFDDDDHLGSTTVSDALVNTWKEYQATFTKDDSLYVLTYKVIPDEQVPLAIRFLSVYCHDTTHGEKTDQAYLDINGKTQWSHDMTGGQLEDLSKMPLCNFKGKAKIELFDSEGGKLDPDDLIGTAYAYETELGKGIREIKFTGCGAKYQILYLVQER